MSGCSQEVESISDERDLEMRYDMILWLLLATVLDVLTFLFLFLFQCATGIYSTENH